MRRCYCQRTLPRSVFIYYPSAAPVRVRLFSRDFHPALQHLRTKPRQLHIAPSRTQRVFPTPIRTVQASVSSYLVLFALTCGGALLFELLRPDRAHDTTDPALKSQILASLTLPTPDPFRLDMPAPPGHLGNLSPEQDLKLREFWTVTLPFHRILEKCK